MRRLSGLVELPDLLPPALEREDRALLEALDEERDMVEMRLVVGDYKGERCV